MGGGGGGGVRASKIGLSPTLIILLTFLRRFHCCSALFVVNGFTSGICFYHFAVFSSYRTPNFF